MCKLKDEGPRCFHHAYLDYVKNTERIERDRRIFTNGQSLTPAEAKELAELKKYPADTLTVREKNRVSILTRISEDNSELKPAEKGAYKRNLTRRAELDHAMDISAVVRGAASRKELSLIRGDVMVMFAKSNPTAHNHPDAAVVRRFLKRLKSNPDTPLTSEEQRVADFLYLSDPDAYSNKLHLSVSGKRHPLTSERFREARLLVERYERLNPEYASPEARNAFTVISALRRYTRGFGVVVNSVFTGKPLSRTAVSVLPDRLRAAYASGKLTPRLFTLAIEQDDRVAVYTLYAHEAQVFPRLYKGSADFDALEKARSLIPATPDDLTSTKLIARRKRLDSWGERIKKGEWARLDEVKFTTPVTPIPEPPSPQSGSAQPAQKRRLPSSPPPIIGSAKPATVAKSVTVEKSPAVQERKLPLLPPHLRGGGTLQR